MNNSASIQFAFKYNKTDAISLIKTSYSRMEDIKVIEAGVKKLLRRLNTSTTCGPDAISQKVLKELATEFAPIISHLFQQTIDTSSIPDEWTTARDMARPK